MCTIGSGATLSPDDPFPSVSTTSTALCAFGDVNVAQTECRLAGTFGENSTGDGAFLDIDGWSHFGAGEPVQPRFFC